MIWSNTNNTNTSNKDNKADNKDGNTEDNSSGNQKTDNKLGQGLVESLSSSLHAVVSANVPKSPGRFSAPRLNRSRSSSPAPPASSSINTGTSSANTSTAAANATAGGTLMSSTSLGVVKRRSNSRDRSGSFSSNFSRHRKLQNPMPLGVTQLPTQAPNFLTKEEATQRGIPVKFWSTQVIESGLGSLLGEGGFAQVFAVDIAVPISADEQKKDAEQEDSSSSGDDATTKKFAVKILRPALISNGDKFVLQKAKEDFMHEVQILSELALDPHDHVIALRGLSSNPRVNQKAKSAASLPVEPKIPLNLFLVLDRIGETLAERIQLWRHERKTQSFTPEQEVQRMDAKLKYAHQIAQAVQHLHQRRILYRDLKPENLGFKRLSQSIQSDGGYDEVLQLFDFGMARQLPPTSTAGTATNTKTTLSTSQLKYTLGKNNKSAQQQGGHSRNSSFSSIPGMAALAMTSASPGLASIAMASSSPSKKPPKQQKAYASVNDDKDKQQQPPQPLVPPPSPERHQQPKQPVEKKEQAEEIEEFFVMPVCGTQRYMAHEVLLQGMYTLKSDSYAWAMVVWEMISQTKPFHYMTPSVHKILVCQNGDRPPLPGYGIPPPMQQLLRTAWAHSVANRISMAEICAQLQEYFEAGSAADGSVEIALHSATPASSSTETTAGQTTTDLADTESKLLLIPTLERIQNQATLIPPSPVCGETLSHSRTNSNSSIALSANENVIDTPQQEEKEDEHEEKETATVIPPSPVSACDASLSHKRGDSSTTNTSGPADPSDRGNSSNADQEEESSQMIVVMSSALSNSMFHSKQYKKSNSLDDTSTITKSTTSATIPRLPAPPEGKSKRIRHRRHNSNGSSSHVLSASLVEADQEQRQRPPSTYRTRYQHKHNRSSSNSSTASLSAIFPYENGDDNDCSNDPTNDKHPLLTTVNRKSSSKSPLRQITDASSLDGSPLHPSKRSAATSISAALVTTGASTTSEAGIGRRHRKTRSCVPELQAIDESANNEVITAITAIVPWSNNSHDNVTVARFGRSNTAPSSSFNVGANSGSTIMNFDGDESFEVVFQEWEMDDPHASAFSASSTIMSASSSSTSTSSGKHGSTNGRTTNQNVFKSNSTAFGSTAVPAVISPTPYLAPSFSFDETITTTATTMLTIMPGQAPSLSLTDLHQRKQDLKETLKQYDINFARSHGRMPRKREKEPVRPLYEHYNALKLHICSLESLKHQLKEFDIAFSQKHGRIPTESEKQVIRHLYDRYKAKKSEVASFVWEYQQHLQQLSQQQQRDNDHHHESNTHNMPVFRPFTHQWSGGVGDVSTTAIGRITKLFLPLSSFDSIHSASDVLHHQHYNNYDDGMEVAEV